MGGSDGKVLCNKQSWKAAAERELVLQKAEGEPGSAHGRKNACSSAATGLSLLILAATAESY